MVRLILVFAICFASAFADSWQCRNDFEARCADGKCETSKKDEFTPMSVSFDDRGKMSVCAYSGCWEGVGKTFATKKFLTLVGSDLKFSAARNSLSARQNISITLDRSDNVATLKAGEFAHPLVCEMKSPQFADYRVRVSKSKSKPIVFRGNRDARMFRTRLRSAQKGDANFAGHYIFAAWGCGTSCVQAALIDTLTGVVYFPKEFAGIGFAFPNYFPDEPWEFQKGSRLFILNGEPANGQERGAGATYLVWQGTKFEEVKFVPVK